MAHARKEHVAADAPNQQTREGNRLRMAPDVAIGLLTRQLAEYRALRMAGPIDQRQQRQRHAKQDAVRDAQCQLSGDHYRGERKFPMAASEQVSQVLRLREVE